MGKLEACEAVEGASDGEDSGVEQDLLSLSGVSGAETIRIDLFGRATSAGSQCRERLEADNAVRHRCRYHSLQGGRETAAGSARTSRSGSWSRKGR